MILVEDLGCNERGWFAVIYSPSSSGMFYILFKLSVFYKIYPFINFFEKYSIISFLFLIEK